MVEPKKTPKIDPNDLRALKDDEKINNPQLRIFHFLTKKTKLDWINFEPNSPTLWIFPFRRPEHDNTYQFTEPHDMMLNYISRKKVEESLSRINRVSQDYYNVRFQKENSQRFNSTILIQASLILAFIGFMLLMSRTVYRSSLENMFGSFYISTFYICFSPWSKLISLRASADFLYAHQNVHNESEQLRG